MRHIRYTIVCAILLTVLALSACAASAQEWDSFENHLSVEYRQGSAWKTVTPSLIHSNENGRLADGIVFFMPLAEYLQEYPAPEAELRDSSFFRVSFDSYLDTFNVRTYYYTQSGGGLTAVKNSRGEAAKLQELTPGRYLAEISISATRDRNEYYNAACYLWITLSE